MNTRALIVLFLSGMLASGCASPTVTVADHLDMETGVTVTRSNKPVIFYRDGSARAAHARDFVYLGPVQINRMGQYRYYLWLGIWSAIPGEIPLDRRDGFDAVTLYADGEPLQLALAGWNEDAIGASQAIYVKPVASAADAFYEVTIDQIRLIAEARDLRLLTSGSDSSSFELWDSQQSALQGFRQFAEQALY